MFPVNRVFAPIYWPPTEAQLSEAERNETRLELGYRSVDSSLASSSTGTDPSTPTSPFSPLLPLAQHPALAYPPMVASSVEQALNDLETLPLHLTSATVSPAVDIHANARRSALRARVRDDALLTTALARCESAQHRSYTRAHAWGAHYTQAIVEYGAAEASSSEFSYLFLERLSTLAPALERHFSRLVFSEPDQQGVFEVKHAAVLFDGRPRVAPAAAGIAPANTTRTMSLQSFMCQLHSHAPRFVIIDPAGCQKIYAFDAEDAFDQNCTKVFDFLHTSEADACNPALSVSFALEDSVEVATGWVDSTIHLAASGQ